METGIYKIESKFKSHRIYIGSAVNIGNRWNVHLHDLRKGNHHSIKLQRHFNKYGEDDLLFSVMERCDRKQLIKREQYYIDLCNPYFNTCKIAGSQLGTKRTLQSRKLMSIKAMNHKNCLGIHHDPWNKGLKGVYSKETLKKMSDKKAGIKLSSERCAILRVSAKKGWITRKIGKAS